MGKILLALCDVQLRKLYYILLKSAGYEVVVSDSITEASAAFNREGANGNPFELVISSIRLGGSEAGGIELLGQIREVESRFETGRPEILFVFFTGGYSGELPSPDRANVRIWQQTISNEEFFRRVAECFPLKAATV